MRLTKRIYDQFRNMHSRLMIQRYRLIYGSRLQTGKGVYARKGFTITIEEDGYAIIGENVFFNHFCSLNALAGIEIGNNCIFGANVQIYDHNHKYSDQDRPINSQGFSKGKVVIGENCWIGSNVTILKGVTIGNHCVVGAGCTIYKDLEANSLIVNNQDQIVKQMTKDA